MTTEARVLTREAWRAKISQPHWQRVYLQSGISRLAVGAIHGIWMLCLATLTGGVIYAAYLELTSPSMKWHNLLWLLAGAGICGYFWRNAFRQIADWWTGTIAYEGVIERAYTTHGTHARLRYAGGGPYTWMVNHDLSINLRVGTHFIARFLPRTCELVELHVSR